MSQFKKTRMNPSLKNGITQASICVLILVGIRVISLPPAAWQTYLAGIGIVFGAYSLKNFAMYFNEENNTNGKTENMKR